MKDRLSHRSMVQGSASQGIWSRALNGAWFKNGKNWNPRAWLKNDHPFTGMGKCVPLAQDAWNTVFWFPIGPYQCFSQQILDAVNAGASFVTQPWEMEHIQSSPDIPITSVPHWSQRMSWEHRLLPMDSSSGWWFRFFWRWKKKTYYLWGDSVFPCRNARRGFIPLHMAEKLPKTPEEQLHLKSNPFDPCRNLFPISVKGVSFLDQKIKLCLAYLKLGKWLLCPKTCKSWS